MIPDELLGPAVVGMSDPPGGELAFDGEVGRAWARSLPAGTYQEFLMEVCDFVDAGGQHAAGVCLSIDGSCGGRDRYCGGCGECMIMQALHAGYRTVYGWERMRVSHRLAWDDALSGVEEMCEETERLAAETIRLMDPEGASRAHLRLPRHYDNDSARRAGLRAGAPYVDPYGGLRVVW